MNNKQKKLHKRFKTCGQNALMWRRECELLLLSIERERIWKKAGFSSIYEYAAKLAGMSRRTVDESLRVLRRIENMPSLKKIAKEKGVQRVRPVATIATKETEGFWAEKARVMTKNSLETYVRDFRLNHLPREDSQPEKVGVYVKIRPELVEKLKKLGDINKLLEQFIENAEELNEVVSAREEPEPIKTTKRSIPTNIKRHVVQRTNGKCAFPGCTQNYQILHHTQRWALEKIHDPKRLQPLCLGHERLAHLGLIENEEGAPKTWRLRANPDSSDPKYWIDQIMTLYG